MTPNLTPNASQSDTGRLTASWHHRAACRDHPWMWWHSEKASELRQAVAVCQQCPVRVQCDEEATERGETWGVWGGKVRHRVRV